MKIQKILINIDCQCFILFLSQDSQIRGRILNFHGRECEYWLFRNLKYILIKFVKLWPCQTKFKNCVILTQTIKFSQGRSITMNDEETIKYLYYLDTDVVKLPRKYLLHYLSLPRLSRVPTNALLGNSLTKGCMYLTNDLHGHRILFIWGRWPPPYSIGWWLALFTIIQYVHSRWD